MCVLESRSSSSSWEPDIYVEDQLFCEEQLCTLSPSVNKCSEKRKRLFWFQSGQDVEADTSSCHMFLKASIFSFSGFVLAFVKVLAALTDRQMCMGKKLS